MHSKYQPARLLLNTFIDKIVEEKLGEDSEILKLKYSLVRCLRKRTNEIYIQCIQKNCLIYFWLNTKKQY